MTYQDYTEEKNNRPYGTWHPEALSTALVEITGVENAKYKRDLEDILYDLNTFANNEYNKDGYRALYDLLVEIADMYARGDIEITA